jgi:hypothetical protein
MAKKSDEKYEYGEQEGFPSSNSNDSSYGWWTYYLVFLFLLVLGIAFMMYKRRMASPQFFRLSDIQCFIPRPEQGKK